MYQHKKFVGANSKLVSNDMQYYPCNYQDITDDQKMTSLPMLNQANRIMNEISYKYKDNKLFSRAQMHITDSIDLVNKGKITDALVPGLNHGYSLTQDLLCSYPDELDFRRVLILFQKTKDVFQ